MALETTLDKMHERITAVKHLQALTAVTRILLFAGFTPPSITKILNQPFTVLPDSHPVGHYFNALYQTGFYYQFIGWAQLTAAILLLFPRTAHLGALMFLPIIANIAVLTISVGFKGTWLITLLMTLAATYLVAWDYDRLKPILFGTRSYPAKPFRFGNLAFPVFFGLGGIPVGLIWWLMKLGNFTNYLKVTAILIVIGALFGALVAIHHRYMRVGALAERN